MSGFDARPLTETVDPAAVRAFASQLKASGRGATAMNVIAIVILGFCGVFFVITTLGMVGIAAVAGGENGGWLSMVPLVVMGSIGALIAIFAIRTRRSTDIRWYRLDRFARANGMTFLPRLTQPALPGMIFGVGSSRQALDLVRGAEPRFVEFANYRYDTGSGKNRTTHKWGYVAVKLDVPLPHIVLDATSNNGLFGATNLPTGFDKDQRLGLEGDFDQHFSLYCPRGYETDALYLFTPDIMARFIDNVAALDVEIVDDWLFLYARRDLSTLDPATWAWLFSAVAALLDKVAQWARWRDERLRTDAAQQAMPAASAAPFAAAGGVAAGSPMAMPFSAPPGLLTPPPPGVARPGQRLQRSMPWATILIVGVFILFWILMQSGFLGALIGFGSGVDQGPVIPDLPGFSP